MTPNCSVWKIIIQSSQKPHCESGNRSVRSDWSMFGGGEQMSYVEFDYGIAHVTGENLKKIDNLVKALSDRPSLKPTERGHSDPEKDYEGLKNYFLNQQIKTQKLKGMVKKGSPEIPVDEKVVVEPQEYESISPWPTRLQKFPKPRTFVGFVKTLPVPEMEKLMLTNIKITDDDSGVRSLISEP